MGNVKESIRENPNIGFAFCITDVRETLLVNGRAKRVSNEERNRLRINLMVHNLDDNSKVPRGVVVENEEAYGHCPRALAFSEIWDERPVDAYKAGRGCV